MSLDTSDNFLILFADRLELFGRADTSDDAVQVKTLYPNYNPELGTGTSGRREELSLTCVSNVPTLRFPEVSSTAEASLCMCHVCQ